MHELPGTVSHDDGLTLTVTRDLSIPVEELWSWITEPDRTAQWYGPWSGDGRVGATVQVTMTSEEGSPTMGMRITECSPPHRLGLASEAPPPFAWPLALQCAKSEGGSSITLHHTQIPAEMSLGDIGPGWEFYLDHLVCAIEGREAPPFEDYVQDLAEPYASHA
ncbi:SRPBCC family protein [Arsenicicoccus cauae]|uniref:SRPBCC family protein n=1 Tax=Arsenicicoccus cauae TaxID=2663847 RepID=UPI00370D8B5D